MEKLDYRYLAFHRRIQELLGKKINEGTREVARWKLKIEKTLMELERGTDKYAKRERRELLVRVDALEYSIEGVLNKFKMLERKLLRVESEANMAQSGNMTTQKMLLRYHPEISKAVERERTSAQEWN